AAGNPNREIASHGAVMLEPEGAIRFGEIGVSGRDGPGAGRKNELRAHQGEGAGDDLAGRKGIRADHQTETAKLSFSHLQAVARRIEIMRDGEFMNFAMVQNDLPGGAN